MQIKCLINLFLSIFFSEFINFVGIGIVPVHATSKIGTLVTCADSPLFNKRLDASVKKLEARLKKYEAGSPPALALEQQISLTRSRFNHYSKYNLLCGKEGLPHLVVNGDWNHITEFVLPGIIFIYITGWIGWVGRKYLQIILQTKNPSEKEIILDIPLALKIMISGYIWPVYSWREFLRGDFVELESEITVSPRY